MFARLEALMFQIAKSFAAVLIIIHTNTMIVTIIIYNPLNHLMESPLWGYLILAHPRRPC